MSTSEQEIIQKLPLLRKEAEAMRELILADVAMIGEIPAPTGGEQARAEFIVQRFIDSGVPVCSVDEKANGIGVIEGATGHKGIVVCANTDAVELAGQRMSIVISKDEITGPFLGDNSLALALVSNLPAYLERVGVRLKSSLILLAAAGSKGKGNLEGLRFFLNNAQVQPGQAICVENGPLGRLNYSCLGLLRGDIQAALPQNYDWAGYGGTGAIIPLAEVINKMSQLPIPKRPITSIVMGFINGGATYSNLAKEAELGFEVRSESAEILADIKQKISDIVDEVSARSGIVTTLTTISTRPPGGIDIAHPLVKTGRAVLKEMGIEPMLFPTSSSMTAFVEAGIPAVTVGATTPGRGIATEELAQSMALPPIGNGMAQLAAMLMAADS